MKVLFEIFLQHLSTSGKLQHKMSSDRSSYNCSNQVRNIAIVGATHGNELHGIYLVKEFNSVAKAAEHKASYPSLCIRGHIGNVAAAKAVGTGAGLRYCETDLNRCFMVKDLADGGITSIEGLRAKEIDALLGPKCSANPKTDLILDLHSTTSNTGILLCCHPHDMFSLRLIAHLQSVYPDISVSLWGVDDPPFLPTVARSGMTIEVGPISHSTSNTTLYHYTKKILNDALNYVENHNQWVVNSMPTERLKNFKLVLYKRFASVSFPRDKDGKK